ncbi:helix-turn-helix domain-containing protein [Bradyrhizobium sp.]|uniref:helix-turn-helix domain-containing protein n=1 Tax=Bradyrhizobium sp. TaxID=376 RepID=UPI0025C2D495|nr:helix-turn-helix domain-containing protein [Bradyrhizobium sp.]
MNARPDRDSSPPLPRGVRRALDAMRANVGRNWTVTELSAAAGLSSRTLQRQFREFLGKTPRAALRDFRFENARRELLQGIPETKVMDVAERCGLLHCGRFSVEYRRRFGETPSQTAKRQAVFTEALTSMPSFSIPSRDRPTVSLSRIDAPLEHSDVALGIADELAAALTRAGAAVVRQAGAARYHLIGAISGSDRQTRLTFRLVDAETGRHLTAYRADGAFGHDAAVDEHLATRIVAAMQPCLRLAEIDRASRKPEADLSPHDMALRAMPCVLSLNAEGNAQALDLLERAMDHDPDNALATALAAWAYGQRLVYHFATAPNEDRARSAELTRKAQMLGGDATVLAVLGNALTFLNDLEAAELTIRKALSIDGGSAWAWSRSGWLDVYNGDADSGIERLKIALDLAPNDSLAFNSMVGIGCAYFESGRYSDAAHWQRRALAEHPSATWIHRTLCPAYVLIGDESEARRSVTALREDYPELTISDVQRGLPPLPQSYCDRVVDALHSVGLPLH